LPSELPHGIDTAVARDARVQTLEVCQPMSIGRIRFAALGYMVLEQTPQRSSAGIGAFRLTG
jgi:hypothetical protein